MSGRPRLPRRLRCAEPECANVLRPDRAYCAEHEPRRLVTMEAGHLIRPYKRVERVDDDAPSFVTHERAREVREAYEDHVCAYALRHKHPAAACRAIAGRP